jgi:hypothetical protein
VDFSKQVGGQGEELIHGHFSLARPGFAAGRAGDFRQQACGQGEELICGVCGG